MAVNLHARQAPFFSCSSIQSLEFASSSSAAADEKKIPAFSVGYSNIWRGISCTSLRSQISYRSVVACRGWCSPPGVVVRRRDLSVLGRGGGGKASRDGKFGGFGEDGVEWWRGRGGRRGREMVGECKVRLDPEEEEVEVVTGVDLEMEDPMRKVKQVALWVMAGVYTSWLFLLPYAPGDPAWAVSPVTVAGVLDLSWNFFFVLPLLNMVGFHLLEAAAAHPADEALFNFVLGWALLFAPLIFTDRKRNRFTGSLDVFWLISMFLTNTIFIPYMAIRLNEAPKANLEIPGNPQTREPESVQGTSALQRAMTSGAHVVAVTGACVGLLSIVWFLLGRSTETYGGLAERWSYFSNALSSDRPSYAFIWDLCCYTVFQPWLIGDNLQNIRTDKKDVVQTLKFVPYVGLIVYCWGLKSPNKHGGPQSKLE